MILYRDILAAGPRTPAHLAGAADLARRGSKQGDLIAIGNPFTLDEPPAGTRWHKLPEAWNVCQSVDLTASDLAQLVRRQPIAIPTAAVVDARGRPWLAPVIFSLAGALALPVPWGRDATTGQWRRSPAPDQEAWIAAATAARGEILASADLAEDPGSGLARVPLEVLADWAATLLTATYHLSREVIQALALLDDVLVVRVLLAAAGMAPPDEAG